MCISVGIFWCFECFYSCWMCSNTVFCKDHFVMTTLLWPNKTQGRQYIPFYHREYQSKPKTSKELLSFWEDNIFGWFTHIGYKKTQFRIPYVLHAIILCIIYTYMIGMKVLLRNKLNDFCTDTLFYCFQVLSVKSFCFNLSEGTEIFCLIEAAFLIKFILGMFFEIPISYYFFG